MDDSNIDVWSNVVSHGSPCHVDARAGNERAPKAHCHTRPMKRHPRGPRKPENVEAGRAIAVRRRAAGLTQVELAERAGINKETMWRIEQGKQYPRASTLDKLAAVFGVTRMQAILPNTTGLAMIIVCEKCKRHLSGYVNTNASAVSVTIYQLTPGSETQSIPQCICGGTTFTFAASSNDQ